MNTCSIKIIISCSSSFLNCNECEYIEGKGESCKFCDTSNQYYPLTYDNGTTMCYQNDSRPDGYYLIENNKFEQCHEGCIKCYGSTNNKCLNDESNCGGKKVCCKTLNSYYPIKDQFDSCYKNASRPDGYYLNSSNSQFKTSNE